jgi:large repetitive protein
MGRCLTVLTRARQIFLFSFVAAVQLLLAPAVQAQSFSINDVSVTEGNLSAVNATFTVTLSAPAPAGGVSVDYATADGTATQPGDYTRVPTSRLFFLAGMTTSTITVQVAGDTLIENDETFFVNLTNPQGGTTISDSQGQGTIVNNDFPSASIAVSPASVLENGAPDLIYIVTLDRPNPVASTSVGYTIASGGATNGVDYATITSPLVIPANATSGTIIVNPTGDTTVEPDETVTLTLASGMGYTIGSPSSATGTITNDDAAPNLTINGVSANEGNSGTTNFTFTVSLSTPAPAGGVSFDIATTNNSATAVSDYVARALTGQTIAAGSSSYSFTVAVNGDTAFESNESFFVDVTNVTGAVATVSRGTGLIANDDAAPSLSINDVTVTEGNSGTTNATFTVTLSAATSSTVRVNYATADFTAFQPGDYTATSGTLTFAPGITTQTITVPVIGDTTVELRRSATVWASAPSPMMMRLPCPTSRSTM